ncbi:MAG: glycosyltransferase family 4 protein [Spirochaetaceae bacterium]|nr:MAG: glycosyltransferase family 4 protein [Spirochaetaceae bacterium]
MKIVVFSDTYLPKIDGVGISTDQFCRLLAERGHEFTVCAPQYGQDDDAVGSGERIRVIRFTNRPLPSYPEVKLANLSLRRIREAMAGKPDLVHIQSPGLLGQYGIAAARLYSVPVVGTYHTMVNEVGMYLSPYRLLKLDKLVEKVKDTLSMELRTELKKAEYSPRKSLSNRLILRLTNELYNRCEVVISPTELIAAELRGAGVKRPLEIVSNGLDLERFHGEPRTLTGPSIKYLHVGRISFEKNVDVLLWAFTRIRENQPDATFDIVGDGPALASLRQEAKRLGFDSAVRFHGFVDRATLPELYPRYDCFLTASTMETQGLVVLEALASGLPAVGVDAYALPELIHHGRNGYLARPFDDAAIAEHAIQVTSDPERYRALSRESLTIAAGHDVNRSADLLEKIYADAVAGTYRPGRAKPGPYKPDETPPPFPVFPEM